MTSLTKPKQNADWIHLPWAIDEGHYRTYELHHERVTLSFLFVQFVVNARRIFAAFYALGALFLHLKRRT